MTDGFGYVAGTSLGNCNILRTYNFQIWSVSLVWLKAPPCHGGDHGFKSRTDRVTSVMLVVG
jgi:hypothetical protein